MHRLLVKIGISSYVTNICLLCFLGDSDSVQLSCVQYLQEKETAKSILQGLKRAESGFPPMDIDHFAL